MERGGLLSHGAIVAREFGIPAVVGVADAQVRIAHDGRIQIDGDRGLVQVSETSSAADEPEHAESVAV
jgi:pyruvate,water dikinase